MYELDDTIRPRDYNTLYQQCINAGWDEDALDEQIAGAATRAAGTGYMAATLKALRTDVRSSSNAASNNERTTQPLRTATIYGQPQLGHVIAPHTPTDDGNGYCTQCQLPPTNQRAHTGPHG